MKRVVASSHVHAETRTAFAYVATWDVEGALLTWKAEVTQPGRNWSLAGGTTDWDGGADGAAAAVREDVQRSIDGLEA
jgi:hypothetical protein